MSSPHRDRTSRRPFADLLADEALRLDTLCDCFEQQLVTGKQPRIETFLGGCDAASRAPLLRELLTLEVDFRLRAGESPLLVDYLTRFPADVQVVREAFLPVEPDDESRHTASWPQPDATLVIPNYILLATLGSGGMGTVYRAVHTLLKNEAAIKVLKTGQEDDMHLRHLFQRETSNLGQLRHPRIVQALYAGLTEAGQPYLVMEMIHGLDLGEVLRRCGPITVADACEVVRQAALGIQHASECGMVHRDIKPSNLLLGWTDGRREDAQIKVADFGLARLRSRNTWRESIESAEPVMGTMDYMAPEQFFTPDRVDIRADIFSLGCTLHTLLVGRPPFVGRYGNVPSKMSAHRDQPIASFPICVRTSQQRSKNLFSGRWPNGRKNASRLRWNWRRVWHISMAATIFRCCWMQPKTALNRPIRQSLSVRRFCILRAREPSTSVAHDSSMPRTG